MRTIKQLYHLRALVACAIFLVFAGRDLLRADTLLGTSTYSYQGYNQSFTVPDSADYIIIKMWGAGGAAGFGSYGGGGAYILARKSATGGQKLTVSVGQGGYVGGAGAFNGGDTWTSGPYNGGGPAWTTASGGQGGGYTLLQSDDGSVLIAGGGGGGSDWNAQNNFQRQMPYGGSAGHPGGGDQPGSPGATGSRAGGAGSIALGGGGGGGWVGGSGGGSGTTAGGGGGGLSGWNGSFSILDYQDGNIQEPGGSAEGDRGNAGSGGVPNGPGGAGLVIIRAYRSTPPTITSALSLSAYAGENLSYQITASNAPSSFGYSWAGPAPGSASIASDGLVRINCGSAGTYHFNVSAVNGGSTASATVTLTITPPVITGSPTASPLVVSPGGTVQLNPMATSSTGFAWVENSIFQPGGAGVVLGSQFGANINSVISYTPSGGSGVYTYVIRIVDPSYNYADFFTTFIVAQNTPAINWPAPGSIVYGTPISATQLSATTSVTGTFSYNPPAGTILPVGIAQLRATFTPADSRNYSPASAQVSLTVLGAPQSVQISPASATILAGATVSFVATGGTNGYSWSSSLGVTGSGPNIGISFPSAGTYTVSVYSPAGGNFLASPPATATVTVAPTYTVNVIAGDGGTVSGSAAYGYGASATIAATANPGFVFAGWIGSDVALLSNPYAPQNTFVVHASSTFTARFADASNPPVAGTVDFGGAALSGSSGTHVSTRTAVTTNAGNSPLELRSFSIASNSTDFSTEPAGGTIPVGASIYPKVSFTPHGSQVGARNGRLVVVTADANNPIVAYDLLGNATNGALPPTLALTLTSLATIFPSDTIALNVQAVSTTSNIAFYDWQLSGPGAAAGVSRNNGPAPILNGSHPVTVNNLGHYTFQVTATDENALQVTSSLSFDVVQGLFSRILSARAEPPPGLQIWFNNSPTASQAVQVWKNRE